MVTQRSLFAQVFITNFDDMAYRPECWRRIRFFLPQEPLFNFMFLTELPRPSDLNAFSCHAGSHWGRDLWGSRPLCLASSSIPINQEARIALAVASHSWKGP